MKDKQILCIDGPKDGQWINYCGKELTCVIPNYYLRPTQLLWPPNEIVSKTHYFVYRLEVLSYYREDKTIDNHYFYIPQDLDKDDVLVRLVKGYHSVLS